MNRGKIFSSLAILLVGVVSAFVIVANFSEARTDLTCKGNVTKAGQSNPNTIYVALNEYRWWVGLWSDSDGNLKVELPNGHYFYYGTIKGTGDHLQIFDGFQDKLENKGSYSKLSKSLKFVIAPFVGFFEGTCTTTNQ